ncbi:hypothetical protein [Halorussus litoreus]|uniref:hypothetical protein n=1 Tax=Halorussus litoreus TaxID=1710536 RepID=UPI001300556A|nr:hypothetical protein [Halorussus litoreus]
MASRRSFLAAGVSGLLAASAGCLGVLDGLDSSPPDPLLQDITVRNVDDESHTVEFALDRDGEQILDATYELGPRNFEDGGPDHLAAVDDAWESPQGTFTAQIRVDGGDRVEFRLDDSVGPATPYRYEIRVLEGGEVSGWLSELETTTP